MANDAALPAATPAVPTTGALIVSLEGLRSAKGMVRACLTRNPHFFPSCDKDPDAVRESVPAGPAARLSFSALAIGDYALSVVHDENSNNRVDTMMGIPREGVGFSRNPRLMFGPPSFNAARIHIAPGESDQDVRIRYFL